MENAVADAKKALESNDKAQMDKARETLTKASHKLAEEMYKAAQANAPRGRVLVRRTALARLRAVMAAVRRKTKA